MNRYLSLLARCTLLAAVAPVLAGGAEAQSYVIKSRNLEGPYQFLISGGPGNTELIGSTGADRMSDKAPNDGDWFYEGPLGNDGKQDHIDAQDGDGWDKIWAGPEDIIVADPGDQVTITVNGPNGPLWSGTYADYKRLQGIVRWLRDRLQALFATSPTAGEPDFWLNAFNYVSAELSSSSPTFGPGESLAFAYIFDIGPYEEGVVPDSPLDCLNWMDYVDDPLVATAAIDFTSDQYAASLDAAQALLGYLIQEVSDE